MLELHERKPLRVIIGLLSITMISLFDKVQGGNELIYHRDNTRRVHWSIKTPSVGIANHVRCFALCGVVWLHSMHPREVPHSKTLGVWVASYVFWKWNEIVLFVIVKEVIKLNANKQK
jgi:hypothetical protein